MIDAPQGLTIGMLGAGGIARAHARTWQALGLRTLVYSQVGAPELAAEFGLEVCDSAADVISQSDLVDICTPTSSHAELALAAIAAGRDVICEKPLALDPDSAHKVAAAAMAAGVNLYPAHVVRYTAPYVRAQQAIAHGELGSIAVARFQREGSRPRHVAWFADFALSGGIVMDLMIHDLDQAAWWLGPVATVFAVQNPPLMTDAATVTSPAELTAHVTMQHVSGAISHCRATWGPPGLPFFTTYSVAGDAGALHYDSRETTTLWGATVTESGAPGTLPARKNLVNDEYHRELVAFYAATVARRSGEKVPVSVTGTDGAYAVELAAAALASLCSGNVVHLSKGASA